MTSLDQQREAVANIACCLDSGGFYLAVENFMEGHEAMNQARAVFGLPAIPVPWHNLYFKEQEFLAIVKKAFDLPVIKDFSSAYYFATRVIYSAMCMEQKVEPDYLHPIHQKSVELPWFGRFSPIRLAVMRKK